MPQALPAPGPASGSVLILGGTAEARALAAATHPQAAIISSLAGRVSRPALPAGPVRIGGFGGVQGLVHYLQANEIGAVVDATHPFAATMSVSAATACAAIGVPLLRLARPGWSDRPDAGNWCWVESTTQAAARALALGSRAFLTSGRQTLDDFAALATRYTLVRVVEPPTAALPVEWEVIRDRGPYSPAAEAELLASRGIDVLVTKDSGGDYTSAKLDAAEQLGVPVVIVRRPPALSGVVSVSSVDAASRWLLQHAG